MQADALDQQRRAERAAAVDAITPRADGAFHAQLRTRQVKGQQIAAMAANGVAISPRARRSTS
jgi:hypothetical protein